MNLPDAEIRTALSLRHRPKARPPKSRGLKVASPAAIHFTPKFAPESKNPGETIRFDFSFPARYGPVRCGKIFGQGKFGVWRGLSGTAIRSSRNAEHGISSGGNALVIFPGGKTRETLDILLLGIRFAFTVTMGRGAAANVAVFVCDSRNGLKQVAP